MTVSFLLLAMRSPLKRSPGCLKIARLQSSQKIKMPSMEVSRAEPFRTSLAFPFVLSLQARAFFLLALCAHRRSQGCAMGK
jgi:hypothetical protein